MSFIIYVEYVEVVICEGQSCGSLRLDYGSVNIYGKFRNVVRMYIYKHYSSSLLSHTNLFCLSLISNSSSLTQGYSGKCSVSFLFHFLFGRCFLAVVAVAVAVAVAVLKPLYNPTNPPPP